MLFHCFKCIRWHFSELHKHFLNFLTHTHKSICKVKQMGTYFSKTHLWIEDAFKNLPVFTIHTNKRISQLRSHLNLERPICSCLDLLYWTQKCVCFEECTGIGTWVTLVSFLPFPASGMSWMSSPQNRLSCTPVPQTTAFSYRRADMKCRFSCYLQSNQSIKVLKRPVKLSVVLNKWWHGGLMWFIFTPAFIWIHFISSCQAFGSKKFLASRIGLLWCTSLTNTPSRSISSPKDLFIQIQIITILSSI